MARNELLLKGYKFRFSKVGGDFKGEATIAEYKHDELRPNELILTCQEKEYNLSTDVTSFSDEKQVEQRTGTSAGKSLGKVALAGFAGKAVQSNRYGTAGMLASVSQGMGTEKTTTTTTHDVMMQFTDGNVLLISDISTDQFKKLDEAYKVFTYETYRQQANEMQDFITQEVAKTRETVSSLTGAEKKAAFEKIEMLNGKAEMLPAILSDLREKALKRGLVAHPTAEEQKVVDSIEKKKSQQLQWEKDRTEKKTAKKQAKADSLTAFQFATKHGYQGLRPHRGIIGILILSYFTLGLFLLWEIWKRKSNKRKWNTIVQADPELAAFREFRINSGAIGKSVNVND
jgi:hypothetical protein